MNNKSSMTEARQVQVPHSYFQKAKTEYSDWRWAMVREFIQNAYDAQATCIDFRLTLNAAGRIELAVDDDGVGMDQDVLENVLLCMGGSRKFHGAIGGFGYAKAILFFAHHGYRIRTNDLLVTGSGGQYRLSQESGSIVGTQITVELDDDPDMLEGWQECIARYVAVCYMECMTARPVTISLDGQVLAQNNDDAFDFNLTTALGDIWYDEVPDCSRSTFVVSVQGLPMFKELVYSNANQCALRGGIELEAGSAALTANRDGFTSAVRSQFSEVVGSLVQDHSAARYGQALELSINFSGHQAMVANTGDAAASAQPDMSARRPPIVTSKETVEPEQLTKFQEAFRRIRHEHYPANFHLKIESLSTRRSARSEAYIAAPAFVAEMNKRRSARLAYSWRAAVMTILNCDWALTNGIEFCDASGRVIEDWSSYGDDTMGFQAFYQGRRVDTGFCFIANTEGLCATANNGDGSHRLFVNPLLITSESGFRLGDTLDLAYHEVAHLWEQHHGESFCGVESKLRQSVRRWLSEREVLARLAST